MLQGYLLLAVSIAAGVVKGFLGKKTSAYAEKDSDAVFLNTVRILLCVLIGAVLTVCGGNAAGFIRVSSGTLAVAAMCGVATSAFIVSWLLAVRTGAYMLVNVFLNLGLIVPLVLCEILYGDHVTLLQWGGVVMLLVAAYLMVGYNISLNGKMRARDFVLLFVCAFSSGMNEFLVGKAFVKLDNQDTNAIFNFYTYLFSFAVLLAVLVFFRVREKDASLRETARRVKPAFAMVALMALCLFLNTFFKTEAGRYLTSVELYPVSIGVSLIGATVVAAVFFHEKPNAKCLIGIVLNFAALLIINCLPEWIG